jgi:hypothetical protein
VQEIAGAVATIVETQEEPWRKAVRQSAGAAEFEGFEAKRLHALLERIEAPTDWEKVLSDFWADTTRLREIASELERLGNPWPDAARSLIKDPDQLIEAEALLASVRERQRPFPGLRTGPTLQQLEGAVPQLASRAAEQLVREERQRYNPLFLWCDPPDAARALLGATARTSREVAPQVRVAVTSVAQLAEDFIRALSTGVVGAWRERWWTVDLLLVHGVEALAETERVQDEFFHLFEALKRRGARMMLTADRPPAAIEGIDERLRSRFEGGLVLQVSGATLPAGAAELVLHDEGAAHDVRLREQQRVGGSAQEFPSPRQPASREVQGGAAEELTPAAAQAERWTPSPENVVWSWPQLDDRIVEELE